MSRIRFFLSCVALVVTGVLTANLASAATIGVNWKEFAGAVNDPIEPYGVEPASNWIINVQNVLNFTDLELATGVASTVDLAVITSADAGGSDTYEFSVLNNTPMRAGLRLNTANSSRTLDFSDLSSTFSTYDIIVYLAGYNGVNGTAVTTLGGTTYYTKVPSPSPHL